VSQYRNRALGRAAEKRAGLGLDTLRDRRPITVAAIGGQQSLTLALDAEARGYANSAVAYRCVAAIADNGSSVPLVVRRPDGSEIEGHEIAHLFNKRPNPLMSARVFKSLLLQQAELAGQAFVWLDRGETGQGRITEMHLVFDQVDVIVNKPLAQRPTTADIIGFIIRRADGTQVPVLPEEMLWIRYPHPFDALGCLAPWKAARHAVDMDAYAREWQRLSYANGARPTGVVYLGAMGENEFNQTKAAWRSSMQGPENAGKTLLVRSEPGAGGQGKNGIGYERLGFTPEEMDYLESRMSNAAEVMLAFGIPHDYLVGGTTYENRSAAKATLWSDTIKGKLEIIGSEVDRGLLPLDTEEAEFDLSGVEALQEAQDSVASRVRAMLYADGMMIDEARAAIGLDPLPGGIGAHTITPYRAQFAPVQGAAGTDGARSWDADFSRLTPSVPDVGPVVERAVEAALARLLGAAPTQVDDRPTARLERADDTPSYAVDRRHQRGVRRAGGCRTAGGAGSRPRAAGPRAARLRPADEEARAVGRVADRGTHRGVRPRPRAGPHPRPAGPRAGAGRPPHGHGRRLRAGRVGGAHQGT